MTATEQQVFDFVARQFLQGESAGLTLQTRLLELNIIDSLGVMVLLAFIERDLGVLIELEDISAGTLQDVSSIAALVDARRKP